MFTFANRKPLFGILKQEFVYMQLQFIECKLKKKSLLY